MDKWYILQVICCHIMMNWWWSLLRRWFCAWKLIISRAIHIYTYGTLLLQQGGNCCPSCSKMYQLQTIPLKLPSFACNLIKQLIKVFGPLLANCCGSIISRAKPLCLNHFFKSALLKTTFFYKRCNLFGCCINWETCFIPYKRNWLFQIFGVID